MIKIQVHKKAYIDDYCDIDDNLAVNYDTHAKFISNEDSTADDIIHMLVDAMRLEGYYDSSIIRALRNRADELDDTLDIRGPEITD